MPQTWMKVLNELDLAFVLCRADGEPVYVSTAAARMLEIRDRMDLAAHRIVLEPILEALSRLREPGSGGPGFSGAGSERSGERIEEIVTKTVTGNPIRLVVSARVLGEVPGGMRILLLADIQYSEGILRTISSFRRSRPSLVLASVAARKPVGQLAPADLLHAAKSLAEEYTSSGTRRKLPTLRADLLSSLSRAIDTVDPLLPGSFRIVNDVSTPVLVRAPESELVCLLVHLLIEASDFGGAFARVRIAARVVHESGGRGPARAVLLGILVARPAREAQGLSPLERYLAKQLSPVTYRVSHRVTAPEPHDQGGDEEHELLETLVGREAPIVSRQDHLVSADSYSENMRLAADLAQGNHQSLRTRVLSNGDLFLTVECPLVVESMGGRTAVVPRPADTPKGKEVEERETIRTEANPETSGKDDE